MSGSQNFANVSSLTDEIVDIIRDRILKGEYKIGEKIKENQIATEFKVSRTPIREAFKQLENEGLIDYLGSLSDAIDCLNAMIEHPEKTVRSKKK